jgi:hypothetical protein
MLNRPSGKRVLAVKLPARVESVAGSGAKGRTGLKGNSAGISKQQARNVEFAMVVRRTDSRCELGKGRCEISALDR